MSRPAIDELHPPEDSGKRASPCPFMKERFTRIYETEAWGDGSGPGSTLAWTREYRSLVHDIIGSGAVNSVVDIGCGDWAFSRAIDWSGVDYLGLDVVEKVIASNERAFGRHNVRFATCDAVTDELPAADLVILKDVLQHWTNDEVHGFLPKLTRFEYALITNDIGVTADPAHRAILNGCLVDGGGGPWRPVDVLQPPFSVNGVPMVRYQIGTFVKQSVLIRGSRWMCRPGDLLVG